MNTLSGVSIIEHKRPEFWRIVTFSFAKDDNYSNIPMSSENNEIDDMANAKSYAEGNNYGFIKLGECVTDKEFIKRENKTRHWYGFRENKKKPRCHNCKFAGQQFKIRKLTHLHCADPKKYNQKTFDNDEFCAWDTLRVFNETCKDHEFKTN